MKLSRYILGLLFLLSPMRSSAQRTPYGLRLPEVQAEIKNALAEFDSVVLADISSYWEDDRITRGIGEKDGRCYAVMISFEDVLPSPYIASDPISPHGIVLRETLVKKRRSGICPKLHYKKLSYLSPDSLNVKSRGEYYLEGSDQNEWTLLILCEGQLTLKQAHDPERYQKSVPTEERSYFMQTVLLLERQKR